MTNPATLVLADGTTFHGVAIGQEGHTVGKVTFNTAMTGYQEALTDPVSQGQLLAFTYPHIGNSGMNGEDAESDRVRAAGLIIRDLPLLTSNFRSDESLEDYLRRNHIIGIAEIDTRRLTRHLRTHGSQSGCIVTGQNPNIAAAAEMAANHDLQENASLVFDVSCETSYEWHEGQWELGQGFHQGGEKTLHVVVMDLGVKRDMLRFLAESGCKVTVVPASTSAEAILALKPNGIFISTGPAIGNPEHYSEIIEVITTLLAHKIPLFAVGLGHQLFGMALGGMVKPLHHIRSGMNHPVQDLASGQVMMTQQNQAFILLEATLPEVVKVTHQSLIDHSIQGIRLDGQVAYSFQGYPEGDAAPLWNTFIDAMWTK